MAKKNRFFLGAFIGGTASAMTALLFAPKSGKELRKDLAEQTDDLKDIAMNYANSAMEKTSEFTEKTKCQTNDFNDQMREAIKPTVYRADDEDELEDQFNQFKEKTDELSNHFKEATKSVDHHAEQLKNKAKDTSDDIYIDVKDSAEKAKKFVSEGAKEARQTIKDVSKEMFETENKD